MARRKKLKAAGDTETRKVWNKKKTRKYTITTTLDERKEKRTKKKASTKKKATTTRKATKTTKARSSGTTKRATRKARK